MSSDSSKYFSGSGDPVRSLALLWRTPQQRQPANGRQNLSVDRIVRAAVEVADRDGIAVLSMRRVAEQLGVGTMSLYTHVPGKGELIDLMLDQVYGEIVEPTATAAPTDWRGRLSQIAQDNWELFHRHPWILQIGASRPPLGPNSIVKYERELRAVVDIGLTAVEMDTVVNLVIGHAENTARRDIDASVTERDSGMTDEQWWQARAAVLTTRLDPKKYPLATEVGEAVGTAHGTAYDPRHNFEFGLNRILDGIETLVASRR
ncbi:TetR/AcrR family transcriptional regulator [Nocardia sp. CNY236]|uniref:TetR/AcrR family transcriptional regulator n=1 Tax=Nocardia sp. CNY236 TaxID=1169152 RepID=UPI0003F6F8CE|nr:TetR/AcrR family transcriptional regulator [Nocardia sp. CNY236]